MTPNETSTPHAVMLAADRVNATALITTVLRAGSKCACTARELGFFPALCLVMTAFVTFLCGLADGDYERHKR